MTPSFRVMKQYISTIVGAVLIVGSGSAAVALNTMAVSELPSSGVEEASKVLVPDPIVIIPAEELPSEEQLEQEAEESSETAASTSSSKKKSIAKLNFSEDDDDEDDDDDDDKDHDDDDKDHDDD